MVQHRLEQSSRSSGPADSNKSTWNRVSHSEPCPICGKPDNCTTSGDGGAVWCGRISEGGIRQNGGGQWLHILLDRDNRPDWWVHPSHLKPAPKPKSKPVDLPGIIRQANGSDVDARRRELADNLQVSAESLSDLGVGHATLWGSSCWTFPERDASGQVVGLNRRYRDGSKKAIGQRGLTYADNWNRGGPVLLVEGGSDTAALMTMGLSAIGRPSNVGGVGHLAEMLVNVPHDRLVVVVAEDDRKPDGQWPGMTGAVGTATRLSELLGRPIAYALPGGDAKDAREWLRINGNDGTAFLTGLLANITIVDNEPEWESLPVVTVKPSTKPVLPMEDIRSEMLESRLWSIGNPGIYLDRSGTGTGKSRQSVEACAEAVKRGQQVLYVAPVHANADEIVGMMVDAGIVDAGKYPQRVYSHPDAGTDLSEVTGNPADDHRQEPVGNCWNESADLAQSLGLSVMSAVCPRCPLREKCQAVGYQHELNGIRGRSAVVATHARGAFQTLNDLGAGREFIVIDEDPVDVLKPMDRADIHYLPKAVDLLREILDDPKELDMIGTATNGGDQYGYLMHLLSVSEQISAAVESATTLAVVELPAGWVNSDGKTGVPPGIQMRLLKNCRQRKKMVTIWRILLAAASGSLSRLVVSFDRKRRGRGAGGEWNMVTVKSLVGVWSNQPPVSATTWLQDGTADPEIVKACLVGRSVVDLTPEAVPPSKYPVVQVPQDISRETSANVVVATLRGLLADRPGVSNVGVICHSTHRKDVEAFKGTDGRIGRVTYFGSGLDVATNVWTAEEHDLLVILGTPRPGEDAIRGLLLQMGDLEAAGNMEPGWESYRWSGWTQSREPVGVESRRYADPAWQRAFQAACRSKILQYAGRGRGACDNGLPVMVVSNENCGLPVTDAAVCKMNATESLVLKELVRLSDERINDYLNRTQMHSNTRKEKGSDSLHVRTGDVSQAVGVSTRKTLNYLKSLERRGLIVHKGKSGWLPVRVAVEPEPVSQVVNEPESSKEPVFQPLDEKPDAQDAVCQPVTGGDDLRVIHKNDASKVLPVKIAGGLHTQPQSQQFLLSAEGVFDGKIYATTGYAQDGS